MGSEVAGSISLPSEQLGPSRLCPAILNNMGGLMPCMKIPVIYNMVGPRRLFPTVLNTMGRLRPGMEITPTIRYG